MECALHEQEWKALLGHIKNGKCTPIIGDGVLRSAGLDRASIAVKLAKDYHYPLVVNVCQGIVLAKDYHYPLADVHDLPRVVQFMALKREPHVYVVRELLEPEWLRPSNGDRHHHIE